MMLILIPLIDLSKVIDDKIANLDTEKIDKFITSLNKYFEQHKNDAKESAKEIKTIRAEIKTDKTELDKELETYYQSREEWINKLKNQNKKYTKAFKTPRGFLAMILLAIFFGLGTGAVITKYLTDKQVIVYKDLDIPKLAQKSGDKDWISAKVLKEEMKNKNTDVNILTFIPWWLILIIAFTFLVIFSPAEEEKKSDW